MESVNKVKFGIFSDQMFVDLGLYQFGQEVCSPGHSFGPAKRNHYLFHYIIKGKGDLHADDLRGNINTYHLHSGEGFMIFPDQVSMYVADMSAPWEYAWLEFDGLRVKQALKTAGLCPELPVYKAKYPELREKMKDEILYVVDHGDAGPFLLIGHMYLFMDYLICSVEHPEITVTSRLREFYIREAIAYIENNYQNECRIEDISAALRLDGSYFGKIFKAATGKTPQRFLMNYRMVKAAELLTATERPINEIGASVGYENQLHFSRAFKTIYGVSPRDWRRNSRIDET